MKTNETILADVATMAKAWGRERAMKSIALAVAGEAAGIPSRDLNEVSLLDDIQAAMRSYLVADGLPDGFRSRQGKMESLIKLAQLGISGYHLLLVEDQK